jgi:hypothetical protein
VGNAAGDGAHDVHDAGVPVAPGAQNGVGIDHGGGFRPAQHIALLGLIAHLVQIAGAGESVLVHQAQLLQLLLVGSLLGVHEHVENDIPKWPDCGGSDELWEEICEHEIIRGRDYQEDIYPADYETHKLGGYPTYAQGAPDIPEGYEFVLQISFDENAGLTIGDLGNYFFFYNANEDDWRVYADCG